NYNKFMVFRDLSMADDLNSPHAPGGGYRPYRSRSNKTCHLPASPEGSSRSLQPQRRHAKSRCNPLVSITLRLFSSVQPLFLNCEVLPYPLKSQSPAGSTYLCNVTLSGPHLVDIRSAFCETSSGSARNCQETRHYLAETVVFLNFSKSLRPARDVLDFQA